MIFNKWQDIVKAYEDGLKGSDYNPNETEEILSNLPLPLFGAAAPHLEDSGKGKLSLPFINVRKFNPTFGEDENQLTGDCVSHGFRNSLDISRGNDIKARKEPEIWINRGATELIYGYRGHMGQGMNGGRAAKFISTVGGILLRQKYGSYDLSKYNPKLGINWGRSGPPAELVRIAKQNPAQTVSLVKTIAEVRDGIANGYGIAICSNCGFSSKRDKYGIAVRKGKWAHCMSIIGCDDTNDRLNETLFLIQNSWGPDWISGPIFHEQPRGSFWIRQSAMEEILRYQDSWIISNVIGFPSNDIVWTMGDSL